jgi:thiamine biosynthesis lipoprotein
VQVSYVLWEVVLLARRAARWSDGLVTPLLLNELEAAGYDRTFEAIDRHHVAMPLASRQESVAQSAGPATHGDPRAIEIDDRTHSIRVLAGVRLDLGGIAKGWAADQAAMRLAIHGPSLVDAGGDIAISGLQADGQRWPVGVADPQAPHRNLELLMVGSGGVATSGRDYRRWKRDGTWQHHILDPRTGRPAQSDVLSATVIAPTAYEADVAAKTALILGSRDGLDWIETHSALAGLLVTDEGQVIRSQRLNDYLWR